MSASSVSPTANAVPSLSGNSNSSDKRPAANEDALLGWFPGQIIIYDYCPQDSDSSESPLLSTPRSIKCIQWNIERGYRLDDVIATLKAHQADIICLQELDVHCARSGYRNSARELAAALEMRCVFIVEFEELFSRRRATRTQGGGWHGNAILTRFPIHSAQAIHHSHHPVDWGREGERLGEPRRGERVTLCTILNVFGHRLAVFSAHLEVFCGIIGRVRQFRDILEASHGLINEGIAEQLIFGDLNTMGHGVARLHPRFCRDSLRWRSVGSSEAAWWHRNIFAVTTNAGPRNERLARHSRALSATDLTILRNPHFYDPVPALHATLRFVRGVVFQGRLDWTLVRGMRTLDYGLDNVDYRKSDHKMMWVELESIPESELTDKSASLLGLDVLFGNDEVHKHDDHQLLDPGPIAYNEQRTLQVMDSDFRRRTFWLLIVLVAILAFTFGTKYR